MIDIQTQDDLFTLISRYIKKDVKTYAFGETAMMFYGYKTVTKDIDILFENEEDRTIFIDAILKIGYKKMSLVDVYTEEKRKKEGKPLMYTRGDERFDLFVKHIFGTHLLESMKQNIFSRHDYTEKNSLIVNVLSKEDIILLKSITEREKDFDDILTIIDKERNINWDNIINNAINQPKKSKGWIILDLEKSLQRLRKHTLIKKEYFDRLYEGLEQ